MTEGKGGTAPSDVRQVVVGEDRDGQRLDNFLFREL